MNTYGELDKRRIGLLAAAIALATAAFARAPNYDEAKVAPYVLEDPLAFADGRKLADVSEWPERRKEILQIFEREMFGQTPPMPETVKAELVEEGSTLAGLAIRRQYRTWFKEDKSSPFLDWIVFIPNKLSGDEPRIEVGFR